MPSLRQRCAEEARWLLEVDSDASAKSLERLKQAADDHCPGVYCIRNPIALPTTVEAGGH